MSVGGDKIYVKLIDSARFELEQAGNPSYAVVLLDEAGGTHVAPMVFSTVTPAADQGQRVAGEAGDGAQVFVVSRSASGQRAVFTVVDPRSLRRLHQRLEVVEETFIQTDAKI